MDSRKSPDPATVQIQTQTGCNGRCIFCPNADVQRTDLEMGKMPPELFQGIVDQLAETQPERILPYLQNEPLLDARLPDFVRYITERIPKTTTLVTSNGAHLTEEMGERLVDAGLKRLKVSLQSLDDETNRAIMGHAAQGVVHNVLAFKRLLRAKRSPMDLRVSTVVTTLNATGVAEARRFWRSHGIRLVTSAVENRGGNIENAGELNLGKPMERCLECMRPSRDMCILFNGQVVLCCVDWFRVNIMGDLREQPIVEVWNGEAYRRVREGHRTSDDTLLPGLCVNCTEGICPRRHRQATAFWRQLKRSFLGPFLGKAV